MYIFVEAERFGSGVVLDTSPRVSSNIPSERCARCSPICTFSTGQISRRRGFDPSFLSKRREVFIPPPQAFQFMIFRKSDFISTFKFKRSSNRIAEGKRNFSSKRKCFNFHATFRCVVLEDSRLPFANFPIIFSRLALRNASLVRFFIVKGPTTPPSLPIPPVW